MSTSSPQDILKPVDKANDPSYLGYSRGTDNAALRPLAQVPELNTKYVQPDYKTDLTYGRLLEGLGTLSTDAVKFTDDVIKNNLNKDLTKSINTVRDSFGVAAAAENADLARSVGQAGAEGTPTNINPAAGGGPLMPQDPNLPLPLQRLGSRLEGLKEQYAQGNLSDSAYYAKQDAEVSKIKARYPGYEDQADKIIESKLGVNPANALRKSLQNDVEKLSNKIQAQNDKTQAWVRSNAGTISQIYGGYENFQQGLSNGTIKLPEVEAKVANFNGKIEADKAMTANIALQEADRNLTSKKASEVSTVGMTRIVDNTQLAVMQMFKTQDLNEIADAIRSGKRPLPTPDEKVALQSQWSLLNQKVDVALDQYLDQPVFDAHHNTVTRRSLIGDDAKVASMKAAAMGGLTGLGKTIFGNEAPSLMQYDANLAKARSDQATNALPPELTLAKAVRDKVGDDMAYDLYSSNKEGYRDKVISGIKELTMGKIAQGGYSIRQTFDDMRRNGQNDGLTNREQIEVTKRFIQKPELLKDKSVQGNAVEHLFGPDNLSLTEQVLANGGRPAATQFFTGVTDEKTVKAISKMDERHKAMVTTWAESAWPTIYNTEVDNVNQSVANNTASNSLKLDYDEKTGKFSFKGQFLSSASIANRANSQIDGFNAAIQSMKRVWEMNGETNITDKLYQWLPQAGVEPGTPVYNLIKKKYDEAHKDTQEG